MNFIPLVYSRKALVTTHTRRTCDRQKSKPHYHSASIQQSLFHTPSVASHQSTSDARRKFDSGGSNALPGGIERLISTAHLYYTPRAPRRVLFRGMMDERSFFAAGFSFSVADAEWPPRRAKEARRRRFIKTDSGNIYSPAGVRYFPPRSLRRGVG